MVRQVKTLAAKPDDLSSILSTHIVKEEKEIPSNCSLTHTSTCHARSHAHTHAMYTHMQCTHTK